MSEVIKDSAIKLFGKTISLQPADSDASLSPQRHSSLTSSTSQDSKDESLVEDYESSNPSEEKSGTSSDNSEEEPKKEKEDSSGGGGEAKKPEKIIRCPRCKSMDTKFCYFNNYNVNQPRHLCKKCQRYWTCGGTMRNVAVGSGRRKTKNALVAPNYHSIMVSDTGTGTDAFVFTPEGFYYCSSPRPWVLGKHSRENLEGVLVPKTLRIHDPSEAAKSSIWTTLGMFKGPTTPLHGTPALLRANPAAFSRSLNFHEMA